MGLAFPWMLLGLTGVLGLAAIYWLRSRSRPLVVSSLVLWSDQRRSRRSGRRIERMQAPLTFFIELAALALLAVAAAGPYVRRTVLARPLIVILDDSYSMQVRDGRTPRDAAQAAVLKELDGGGYVARFILAGPQPQVLGAPVRSSAQAREAMKPWQCASAGADLSRAIALGTELGGGTCRILVVTDHPPASEPAGGQVQWWSFGRSAPNVAITAAARTGRDEIERVLLEVANLSPAAARAGVTLEGANFPRPQQRTMDLAPGQAAQVVLELPAGAPPLRARLADDALAADNEVTLLSDSTRTLRVDCRAANPALAGPLQRALKACRNVLLTPERPGLIIAEVAPSGAGNARPSETEGGQAWLLEIIARKDALAYAGPFVVDRSHPLTAGLSLAGAIWAAGKTDALRGTPVVTAGNVVLLADSADLGGRHHLRMVFSPELSNVQDSPDWPILVSNLVGWRLANEIGPSAANVGLGRQFSVTLPRGVEQAEWVWPDGSVHPLGVHGRCLELQPQRVGLHTVRLAGGAYTFSCNALDRAESDLTACGQGRWGNWNSSQQFEDRRVGLSWWLLLAVLALLAGHAAMIARRSAGVRT